MARISTKRASFRGLDLDINMDVYNGRERIADYNLGVRSTRSGLPYQSGARPIRSRQRKEKPASAGTEANSAGEGSAGGVKGTAEPSSVGAAAESIRHGAAAESSSVDAAAESSSVDAAVESSPASEAADGDMPILQGLLPGELEHSTPHPNLVFVSEIDGSKDLRPRSRLLAENANDGNIGVSNLILSEGVDLPLMIEDETVIPPTATGSSDENGDHCDEMSYRSTPMSSPPPSDDFGEMRSSSDPTSSPTVNINCGNDSPTPTYEFYPSECKRLAGGTHPVSCSICGGDGTCRIDPSVFLRDSPLSPVETPVSSHVTSPVRSRSNSNAPSVGAPMEISHCQDLDSYNGVAGSHDSSDSHPQDGLPTRRMDAGSPAGPNGNLAVPFGSYWSLTIQGKPEKFTAVDDRDFRESSLSSPTLSG